MTRYLVTGGAGFIGSNLCEALRADDHEVIALDNLTVSDENVPFLRSIGVKVVIADIARYEDILPHFAGVDVVFHFAAMNRAPRSIEDPVGAHHVNITGTLNVLQAMRAHTVPKIIFASSSSVYAGREGFLKESDPLAPPHPYGVGKLAAEHYVRVYQELYGLKYVTLRFFSVYGQRQLGTIQHAAVIPKFIECARNGEPLPVYGDGKAMRNYTYVDDVVRCCRLAVERADAEGHVINIANHEEVTVNELAQFVLQATSSKSKVQHLPPRPGDPPRNAPDLTLAKKLLDFVPAISYQEGIRRAVQAYDTDKETRKARHKETILILGLGYVGLPLAARFSRRYKTIGLDINSKKIEELKKGFDHMGELTEKELKESPIEYTTDPARIAEADIVIAAVPTPVDGFNIPDLTLVKNAAKVIGKHMKRGTIVVYESTVYPGVTEDECVPILEKESGLVYNKEFFVGYSPERVNPGDKEHTIERIIKIVSGSSPEATNRLEEAYGNIVTAGIHVAPNIKVAEAAKVIENVQRDLNIALVNELTVLFDKLNINVHDVLRAAGTKWNFHRYTPGLVGGHCIGVDPYYLTYKAVEVGHHPDIILAGRRLNDNMHHFYAQKAIKELNAQGIATRRARVGVLGLTFKENCNDYRNSRSKQLVAELKDYGVQVIGIDPWLDDETIKKFGCIPGTLDKLQELALDGIIITVPHTQFFDVDLTGVPVVVDIKGKISRR